MTTPQTLERLLNGRSNEELELQGLMYTYIASALLKKKTGVKRARVSYEN